MTLKTVLFSIFFWDKIIKEAGVLPLNPGFSVCDVCHEMGCDFQRIA